MKKSFRNKISSGFKKELIQQDKKEVLKTFRASLINGLIRLSNLFRIKMKHKHN